LVTCAAVPIYFWFAGDRQEALVFLLLTLLTTFMHRGNIVRLSQGTEGKIGKKAEASRGT
jgi:glycerol-3-phosphate acyltransferase PlsY